MSIKSIQVLYKYKQAINISTLLKFHKATCTVIYYVSFSLPIFVCVCVYRYGKPGCDAETCDYFLSYRRIGTDVEFEMSADTDGWVAVGFSSDKKMVIIKESQRGSEISAGGYFRSNHECFL